VSRRPATRTNPRSSKVRTTLPEFTPRRASISARVTGWKRRSWTAALIALSRMSCQSGCTGKMWPMHPRRLPFLFKVLASAKPLSIQAHPNRAQARQGFARENELGIPLDAPNRNYKDDNHKPEIICALTPFWALIGFRKIEEMIDLLERLQIHSLEKEIDILRAQPNSAGLKDFFRAVMTLDKQSKEEAVGEALVSAEARADEDPVSSWMIKLHQEYPGDIGVLSTVLLNLIRLEPGDALYQSAGELHAYLEGVGMELMANSDNVLRGGLTPKHVDVPELLNTLNFS